MTNTDRPDWTTGPIEVAAKCPTCGQWIAASQSAEAHAGAKAIADATLRSHQYGCPKGEKGK